MSEYPFFELEKNAEDKTAVIYLNRPEKRNAMSWAFWRDLPKLVADLDKDKSVRCVIIAARGKSFSTGLDLEGFFADRGETIKADTGDKREELMEMIAEMQSGMNAIAESPKPYIAAIHKHCIGGGVDLIAACDLRLATRDASFSIRETKVAIVADMGSLNRLPYIIGEGNTRMMALTGRDFKAEECMRMGLLNEVHETQVGMMDSARKLAAEIAANPVMAVSGTKQILNYGLNHTQQDGLKNVVLWNTAYIDSQDLREMVDAFVNRRKPNFKE